MLDLDHIKLRLAYVQNWPWLVHPENPFCVVTENENTLAWLEENGKPYCGYAEIATVKDQDDADFIANAPADLAALVAEVERLRELLNKANEGMPSLSPSGGPLGTIKAHWPVTSKDSKTDAQVNTGGGGRSESSPTSDETHL